MARRRVTATSLTQKGQVTIPIDVRRALRLKPRDLVLFELDSEHSTATIRRAPSTVMKLYGSLSQYAVGRGERDSRAQFEEGVADEVMSETP